MRSLLIRALALLGLGALASACAAQPPAYGYKIVRTYPHDPGAFTQGLFILDGHLYESTGQIGQSTIRKVRIQDGRVLKSVNIPAGLFGEGIVNWGRQIDSVTWQGGAGFRWDRDSLKMIGRFSYPGEGWGLTQDGKNIILSDGTPALRFLDPATMRERKRVAVTVNGKPLGNLNELEWVKGEVFANVWQTNVIARIDPDSGKVTGVIDFSGLPETANRRNPDAVLNGIAYDGKSGRLFVTGKNWPYVFEIKAPKDVARD
jgi:glutamine cyclotransferase